MRRLQIGEVEDTALVLSQLPESPEGQSYLAQNMRNIGRAIGASLLTNQNLASMFNVLWHVFEEVSREAELSDIVESIPALLWRTTTIGTDPLAVIESFVKVNGVTIKLVGTRTYLPQYLNLGDDLAGVARYAAHFGTPLEIMWADPHAWYAAARDYLSTPDENFDEAELVLPKVKLSLSMLRHEAWFKNVLLAIVNGAEYGDEDELDFIPLITSAGCYVVFGIPSSDAAGADAPEHKIVVEFENADNDSSLVLIEGLPICVEWLSVSWETGTHLGPFEEYFATIRDSLLSHPDCDVGVGSRNGASEGVLFIRPATQWDISSELKLKVAALPGQEAWALLTDHIQLADAIFEKVAKRDLTSFERESGVARYILELETTGLKNIDGCSLALEVVGASMFHWTNLVVGTTGYTRDDGEQHIALELNDRIFALVELVGKKTLLEAVKHGLVLQRPLGFHEALDKVPQWCSRLRPPSSAIIRMLENRFKLVKPMSLFELWRHTKTTKYRKNNY